MPYLLLLLAGLALGCQAQPLDGPTAGEARRAPTAMGRPATEAGGAPADEAPPTGADGAAGDAPVDDGSVDAAIPVEAVDAGVGGGDGDGDDQAPPSDGGTDAGPNGDGGDGGNADLLPFPDLAVLGYPGGPYGGDAGETLGNFVAAAYLLSPAQRDPGKLPVENVYLSDFRRCRCLLVTVEAFWCPPCKFEQPHLVAAVERDPSICLVEILAQGAVKPHYPTLQELAIWAQTYRLNFPLIAGNSFTRASFPNKFFPTTYVVRTDSMQIVDQLVGASEDLVSEALKHCPP